MRIVAALFLLLSVFVTAFGSPVVVATNDDDDKKVTICHATGSATNPYVEITVSRNSVYNDDGSFKDSGHGGHNPNEPGGDIIPAPAEGCPDGEEPTPTPTATATDVPATATATSTPRPPVGSPPPVATATATATGVPTSPPTVTATVGATAPPTATGVPTSVPPTVATATPTLGPPVPPPTSTPGFAPTAVATPTNITVPPIDVPTLHTPVAVGTPKTDGDTHRRNGTTPNKGRTPCDEGITDNTNDNQNYLLPNGNEKQRMEMEAYTAWLQKEADRLGTTVNWPKCALNPVSHVESVPATPAVIIVAPTVGPPAPTFSPAPTVEEVVVETEPEVVEEEVVEEPTPAPAPVQVPAKGARQDVAAPAQIKGNGKGVE